MCTFKPIPSRSFRYRKALGIATGLCIAFMSSCGTDGNNTMGDFDGANGLENQQLVGSDKLDNADLKIVYRCCANNKSYACPDEESMDTCAGQTFDIFECEDECFSEPDCLDECQQKALTTFPKPPDPSKCQEIDRPVEEWCVSPPPSDDCTRGGHKCEKPDDCKTPSGFWTGEWCNKGVGKCFTLGHSCVGTPCAVEADCPLALERCSKTLGECVACTDAIDCASK